LLKNNKIYDSNKSCLDYFRDAKRLENKKRILFSFGAVSCGVGAALSAYIPIAAGSLATTGIMAGGMSVASHLQKKNMGALDNIIRYSYLLRNYFVYRRGDDKKMDHIKERLIKNLAMHKNEREKLRKNINTVVSKIVNLDRQYHASGGCYLINKQKIYQLLNIKGWPDLI